MSYNKDRMTSPFLHLLKQIADGVVIFEPFPRTSQGIQEFQDTVHRLEEMHRLGLIGPLFIQKRTSRGLEYVDMVTIQGGNTPEGERLLAQEAE